MGFPSRSASAGERPERCRRRPAGSLLLAGLLLAGCRAAVPASTPAAPPRIAPPDASLAAAPLSDAPLPPPDRRWVEETLAGLALAEKAAQMVFVRAYGRYENPRAASYRDLLAEVRKLGVGGIVLFRSELESVPRLLDELQSAALVPLLVAADLERGLAFRVERGTVPLPTAMAVGATRSEEAARFTGEVTAREARAVGVHWALAPVADVNSDPANPAVNVRSYGEDPELVARLAAAFVRGARQGGLLTTAKHFPGHGATAVDSHRDLPVLAADRERLAAVEWVPFRRAVEAGVDAVMLGHVAVPAVDPSGAPATLSPILAGEALRGELGFGGLIVTDALEMEGLRPAWTGEAAVRAVAAGADVLLLPDDPRVAVRSLVRAVEEGQLAEERLDGSVRRLLEAKARLGLHRNRRVDPDALARQVARPEDVARVREIAAASITVVRDPRSVLPLPAEEPLSLLHLVLTSDFTDRAVSAPVERELAARRIETTTRFLGPDLSEETAREVLAAAGESTHVLVSAFVRARAAEERGDLAPSQRRLLERLAAGGAGAAPVIVVSFGTPYLAAELPKTAVYACAYGAAESSQRAAVAALFGETAVGGKLPVTLPGLASYGHGLEIPRRPMTLARARPEEAGFRPGAMEEVDALLAGFVERRAFPGGVLAVGYRGKLVHLRPFGRLTYDAGAPPVTADTLYDLASLTKVVATTTMAMILVDEGRLDLDRPVQAFLPGFRGPGKEAVTVRHLLTHSSGIDGWAPLYEELAPSRAEALAPTSGNAEGDAEGGSAPASGANDRADSHEPPSGDEAAADGESAERGAGTRAEPAAARTTTGDEAAAVRAAYVERIAAMDLAYEPGSRSKYSDLGVILLGEVLERAAGRPLDAFVRERLLEPLGMADTRFRPGDELDDRTSLARIAPTEIDPWRGRLVHGEVHDENAFAMGGVAPHAGLFGTAPDLARFAQMMANGGVLEHRRIVSRATVERFTRRAGVPDSTRALGWDTKSPEGSSAGSLFSPASYGHTGFTGTSLWIDPGRDLFVVLLTNRVHPTRENQLIREARPAVADAVVRGLAAAPETSEGAEIRSARAPGAVASETGEGGPPALRHRGGARLRPEGGRPVAYAPSPGEPATEPPFPGTEPASEAGASGCHAVQAQLPAPRGRGGARLRPGGDRAPDIRVGLERLAAGEGPSLAGKRLGLVAHAASVTVDGRHAVDLLRDAGLDVVRLFAPEHGLYGAAAAGEPVADGRDPASGLPVVSLYGARTAPTAEQLADLDALLFDLQDAGVRFYTYAGTLILTLEAAAEAGVELVVLDRTNPLGGERVEGPVSAPREVVPASLVNLAPGPLVHGLTLGEMARLINARRERPARLTVVPMSGWRRSMTWADTGRPWVPPSPNLRSAEAALAYPGTALLEATNVSEGRGTETPFLLLGAPWLEVTRLGFGRPDPARADLAGSDLSSPVPEAPGFTLEPARFTPRASPAAPQPKHLDRECSGLRVRVTDPAAAEPYRLGLTLLAALARQPGFEWRQEGDALTRLLGTPRVLADIRAGKPVDEILAADRADHAAWRERRRPALLYD